MNATAAIFIAIAVVGVLAAIAFVTLARRSDVRGAGALSAETVARDEAARKERATSSVATSLPPPVRLAAASRAATGSFASRACSMLASVRRVRSTRCWCQVWARATSSSVTVAVLALTSIMTSWLV